MKSSKKVGRFVRKPGTKITYSNQQRAEYKSLEAREERAIVLLNSWDRNVYHEPASDSENEIYYFQSDRASGCEYHGFAGCHTVTVNKRSQPPIDPPILPGLPPEGLPQGGNPAPTTNTVFVAHLGSSGFEPGLPPQIRRATGIRRDYPPTDVPLPWIQGEQTIPGVTIASSNFAVNLIRIIAPLSANGQTLDELDGGYWVTAGKLHFYTPSAASVTALLRYVPLGVEVVPTSYNFDAGWREYAMPPDYDTPLTISGLPLNTIAYPLGVDPDNPTQPPNVPFDDPTPAPGKPSPDDPGKGQYECTCPDYTRRSDRNDNSSFPSEWSDRDWSDSDAGAPVDDEGRAFCKHVIATMMHRGEW